MVGKKRIEIEKCFARVKISFHSGWAKIITRWEKNGCHTFRIYKASTSCENDSSSFSRDRLNFFDDYLRFFFLTRLLRLRKLVFFSIRREVKICSREKKEGRGYLDRRLCCMFVFSGYSTPRVPQMRA